MNDWNEPNPRIIVATLAVGRSSAKDDFAQLVVDELDAARFQFVRSVVVNREKSTIQQLISHVANSNEADAIILVGGVGIGPRDSTCEAVDELADRRIEGFGEAYRALLRDEFGAGATALLARATAGICNKCVTIALPRKADPLRRALRTLVLPTLSQAVRLATGVSRGASSLPSSSLPPPAREPVRARLEAERPVEPSDRTGRG